MVAVTDRGLYCAEGDFYIDPSRAVDRAVVTHAHSDHARPGSASYLTAAEGVGVLKLRLGRKASITGVPYGQRIHFQGVTLSFHPAGHVLGSAQIRLERGGEVWVISGDYKTEPDPTCTAFEPVRCHTFITECTFGLPIYQWAPAAEIFTEIHDWWSANQARGQRSLLLGYALGKAPRLLADLHSEVGDILVHPSVQSFLPAYAAAGVRFPEHRQATPQTLRESDPSCLLIAPPQFVGSRESQAWADSAVGMASGWMHTRAKTGRSSDGRSQGFALSDHADWPGLIHAIRSTGAHRVLATHGYTAPLVRWLREQGYQAEDLELVPPAPGAPSVHPVEPDQDRGAVS